MQLAAYGLLDFLGVIARLELIAVKLDIRGYVILVAEFLADDLHLLAQIIIALDLVHLLTDLDVDFLLHVQDFQLACEDFIELLEAFLDIDAFDEHLTRLELEVQMARDEVSQTAGIVDNRHRDESFLRDFAGNLDPFLKFVNDRARRGFHWQRGIDGVRINFDIDLIIRLKGTVIIDARALLTFDEYADRAARQLDELADGNDGANLVNILALRFIEVGIALGRQHDAAVADHGFLEGHQRTVAADIEMYDHIGKYHHAAQRQQWQCLLFWHIFPSFYL